MKSEKAVLVLKDGTRFEGRAIGKRGISVGEVVFNTSMTGYQEILTDPSYAGQIITFTYPLIGNYDTNYEDLESRGVFCRGAIVKELEDEGNSWRGKHNLEDFLMRNNVIGIAGIDTRKLTRHIRNFGVLNGAIVSGQELTDIVVADVKARIDAFTDREMIREVSCKAVYHYDAPTEPWVTFEHWTRDKARRDAGGDGELKGFFMPKARGKGDDPAVIAKESATAASLQHEMRAERGSTIATSSHRNGIPCNDSVDKAQNHRKIFHLVAMDFGIKTNILRMLYNEGFDITVVPQDTSFETIVALQPDGIFLSNGPGDPKSIPDAIKVIGELIHYFPTMGICLGHQLLALATGGDTYKLKFGHRGGNHPVKDLKTGRVYITSQNHGYAVNQDSLVGTGLRVTLVNLNDQTVEGMDHENLPVFSVQYHPEASPGPQDNHYLFGKFRKLIEKPRMG